ncbi:unnamed protein product [Meloidogyne enterolobii]|uniref:Uncharacterized protein n=1 Tax=Meloidogyne enterolobii TaxID=390850 RepID=A0ACB1ARB3_MELEN
MLFFKSKKEEAYPTNSQPASLFIPKHKLYITSLLQLFHRYMYIYVPLVPLIICLKNQLISDQLC